MLNECLNPFLYFLVIDMKESGGNDAHHFVVEMSARRTQKFRPTRNMVVDSRPVNRSKQPSQFSKVAFAFGFGGIE